MTAATRKKTGLSASAVKKGGGVSSAGASSFKKVAAPPSRQVQVKGLLEEIRTWRDDSFAQRLYQSALFWGEKIVAMTDEEPMDFYYLALIYYHLEEYLKCSELLKDKHLLSSSVWAIYIASQCCIQMENWQGALEILGENRESCDTTQYAVDVKLNNLHGRSIKIESSLCYLRGVAFLHQGSKDRAKDAFIEALHVDCHCFEALKALLDNYMLNVDEEKRILDDLPLQSLPPFEAEFIKSLYISRLTKYNHLDVIENAHNTLQDTYGLSNSPLVQLGKAELLMIQFNYKKAFEIIERIRTDNPYHMETLTLYIVCLAQLNKSNALFLLAHELVELFPKHCVTWFAVGTYYFCIKKYLDARRYFGKSTAIEPSFGQAWIGFAHSFALEGEHESAISIYSSACRVLPGIHLPKLFLGMEHLRLQNWKLAQEFLQIALETCPSDPQLYNELGLVSYENQEYDIAINHFGKVLDLTQAAGTPLRLWASTLCNLGHCYRRKGDLIQARKYFEQAIENEDARESSFGALGMIECSEERLDLAVECFHKALAINPNNRQCAEMLDAILSHLAYSSKSAGLPIFGTEDESVVEEQLQKRFARDGDNLDFPDLEEEEAALDPEEMFFDLEKPAATALDSVASFSGGMLTRGRLRGRSSNIIGSSPGSGGVAPPKRGLLKFTESSPPDPFQGKSPPRMNRKLFVNRNFASSEPESASAGLNDSLVLAAGGDDEVDDSDEMEIDEGSGSSDL